MAERNFGRIAAAALILAAGGIGATVAAAPAAAQHIEPGTNGSNVRYAGFSRGRFVADSNGRWVEYDAQSRVRFTFREIARDQWSVYLKDTVRAVELQIDIYRKMITYSENGGPRRDLYPITGASRSVSPYEPPRSARGPGGRDGRDDDDGRDGRGPGGWGRGEVFNIDAGPIWNQADAERKCPDLARRVDGTWTGQWSTIVPSRVSHCGIRIGR